MSERDASGAVDLHLRQVRRFRLQDSFFHHSTQLFAFVVLATLVGILVSLTIEAWPSLQAFGPSFFWTNVWSVPDDQYGALAAIYGTVVTSVLALLIAVPISFGIAFFLTETCPPWLRRPLGTAVELLAGIPSIVYGIWGLFVFAPLFAEYIQPPLQDWLGDVPVIGAGTYASNADGCAVSATGDGEYFIRATVARDICARIGATTAVDTAAQAEIDEAKTLGGLGGVIVWSAAGTFVVLMICKFTTGLRVTRDEEVEGLDYTQHGEAIH